MSRRPIGSVAMSDAERQQRRRDKVKALRDSAMQPARPHQNADVVASPDSRKTDEFPKMLYHQDGRTIIAATPEHQEELTADGWGTTPLAAHQKRPVSHHGFLGADTLFALPARRW